MEAGKSFSCHSFDLLSEKKRDRGEPGLLLLPEMDGMKGGKRDFFSPPYLANWTLLAEGKNCIPAAKTEADDDDDSISWN